jgi:exodeoxyribonuclease V gamma subunit
LTEGETGISKALHLRVGDLYITGALHGIYGDQLIYVCASNSTTKHLITAYIQYLAGVASGYIRRASFLSVPEEAVLTANSLSSAQAIEKLEELIVFFRLGQDQILPFFTELDFTKITRQFDSLTWEGLVNIVSDKIDKYYYPLTDPYIRKEFTAGYWEEPDQLDRFKQLYQALVLYRLRCSSR